MKTIVFGVSAFLITVMTILLVITVCGQTQMLIINDNNLKSALHSSLKATLTESDYSINDTNELVANLLEKMSVGAADNEKLKIEIMAADKDTGVLSVRATATYTQINGKEKSVTTEQTVIVNPNTDIRDVYTVTYNLRGNVYKKYEINAGEALIVPKNPSVTGYTFGGWMLNGEVVNPAGMTVDGDLIFEAILN